MISDFARHLQKFSIWRDFFDVGRDILLSSGPVEAEVREGIEDNVTLNYFTHNEIEIISNPRE